MTLKFALFENHLTSDPDDYMAVVQDQQSKSQDDIIDLMIGRGSTVTKAEALSVMEEYAAAIEQFLKDGNSINTPLFNLSLSVKGVFDSPDESFNASKHAVQVNITTGKRLSNTGSLVGTEKVDGSSPKPDISYVYDFGSDTRSESLTPGNIAQIRGSRLKFDNTDPDQGIFLIASDNTETKASIVSRNKPAQLDFLVPALAAGDYRLVVRSIFHKTTTIRSGEFSSTLNVVAR